MKNLLGVLTFILAFAFLVSAQTTPDASCPTVRVKGGGRVRAGEPMTFTAQIDAKGKDLNLKYVWSVVGGKIVSGQGELTITVDWVPNKNVTATLEVEGFPKGCSNTYSEVGNSDEPPAPSATLMDEFGVIPNGELEARLDGFFTVLGNEPNAQGYIINYGTGREIARREAQIRNRVALRKYDGSRLTFVRGGANPEGKRGAMTKLWIVPPGATPPTP